MEIECVDVVISRFAIAAVAPWTGVKAVIPATADEEIRAEETPEVVVPSTSEDPVIAQLSGQPVPAVVPDQCVVTATADNAFDIGLDIVALARFPVVRDTVEVDTDRGLSSVVRDLVTTWAPTDQVRAAPRVEALIARAAPEDVVAGTAVKAVAKATVTPLTVGTSSPLKHVASFLAVQIVDDRMGADKVVIAVAAARMELACVRLTEAPGFGHEGVICIA